MSTTTSQSVQPRLRSLPVPVSEPRAVRSPAPRRPAVASTQGALALSFTSQERLAGEDPEFARQPTSSEMLPDPSATTSALVQAVVEVLAGVRPASQLVRWMSHDVHGALSSRAALATRLRRGTPPTTRQAVVRGVRVCSPTDGVVEASAVVIDGDRVRAVAVRLEGLDGRWRATALEMG